MVIKKAEPESYSDVCSDENMFSVGFLSYQTTSSYIMKVARQLLFTEVLKDEENFILFGAKYCNTRNLCLLG